MSTMSPELALVDPELRADGIARLPPIYVNAFLEARPVVVAPRRGSPRGAAAASYLLLAIVRTLVFEAAVFAAVFAAVLIASLIG